MDIDAAATAARELSEETLGLFGGCSVDGQAVAQSAATLATQLRAGHRSVCAVHQLKKGQYHMFVAVLPFIDPLLFQLATEQNAASGAVQGAEKQEFAWVLLADLLECVAQCAPRYFFDSRFRIAPQQRGPLGSARRLQLHPCFASSLRIAQACGLPDLVKSITAGQLAVISSLTGISTNPPVQPLVEASAPAPAPASAAETAAEAEARAAAATPAESRGATGDHPHGTDADMTAAAALPVAAGSSVQATRECRRRRRALHEVEPPPQGGEQGQQQQQQCQEASQQQQPQAQQQVSSDCDPRCDYQHHGQGDDDTDRSSSKRARRQQNQEPHCQQQDPDQQQQEPDARAGAAAAAAPAALSEGQREESTGPLPAHLTYWLLQAGVSEKLQLTLSPAARRYEHRVQRPFETVPPPCAVQAAAVLAAAAEAPAAAFEAAPALATAPEAAAV